MKKIVKKVKENKILIVVASIVVVALVGVIIYLLRNKSTTTSNTNNGGGTSSGSNATNDTKTDTTDTNNTTTPLTRLATPTITTNPITILSGGLLGTGVAGAKVIVKQNGNAIAQTTVGADGSWVITGKAFLLSAIITAYQTKSGFIDSLETGAKTVLFESDNSIPIVD